MILRVNLPWKNLTKKCYKNESIPQGHSQPSWITSHHLWSDLRWVAKRKKRIQEARQLRRLDSDSLVGRCSWKTADRSILVGFWMVRMLVFQCVRKSHLETTKDWKKEFKLEFRWMDSKMIDSVCTTWDFLNIKARGIFFFNTKGCISLTFEHQQYLSIGGGNSNMFKMFTPKILGKMNPFWLENWVRWTHVWLAYVCQMGWEFQPPTSYPLKKPSHLTV